MYLTDEQQAILNGSKGEVQAKVMKTLVMYGETFGADKLVPATSKYNHLVTSFGLKMMNPMKRIFTFFLALLMFLSAAPLAQLQVHATGTEETSPAEQTASPEEPSVHGTSGKNLTWTLDGAGTLTISGSGAMEDVSANCTPWNDYRDSITKVIIRSGVTYIGMYAFYSCKSLTDVIIEEGLISIGRNAFAGCFSLKNVSLPESLTTIKSAAFHYCNSLEQIRIPDKVNSIGMRTFRDCTSLTSVTLPAKLTELDTELFYNCTSLKSIVIPEGVIRLRREALRQCTNLESVWLPLSLTHIDWDVFTACRNLNDIYYPGSSKQFRNIIVSRDPGEQNNYFKKMDIHLGIPDLVTPEVQLTNNAQTGLQELVWKPIADAVRYEIYKATAKNGSFSKVADTTDVFWQDPEAAIGKTCYYQVKAIHEDLDRSSACSTSVAVTFVCGKPLVSAVNDSEGKPYLSWEKVSGAKKYTVYRASSENGKYSKLGTTSKIYYTDSKAKAGTTYYYKVMANASSIKNNSPYSDVVTCGVICATPSVTVKIDTATGNPNLTWKKVDGAAEYAIYRKLPADVEFVLLTQQTAVTYTDRSAPIDTKCEYYVQALGKTTDLNGAASKVVSATSGIAKPAVKGSIHAVSGKPVLSWDAIEGAVKYEVYRSTKSSKGYTLAGTVEETTFEDTSVSAGKTYYYKVKAIGEVSKSTESSYVKLTGKCTVPVITVSPSENSGKPVLTWEKISGAKKYTVYRATSETGKYSKLGTTTKPSYTDSKAAAGTVYFYRIVANASSSKYNSPYSNIVFCGVNCSAPTVKVSLATSGKPVLSWSKITGAVKYEVYKNSTLLDTVTATNYTDNAAQAGESCSYTVKAINKVAQYSSVLSKAVSATATCATPKATGKVGVNYKPLILWDAVEGAQKYVVYRSTSKSNGYKVIGDSEDLNFEDLTAKKGKTYYYKIVAVGETFQSAQSGYVKVKSK